MFGQRIGHAAGVGVREGAGWAAGLGVILAIANARQLVTDVAFARGLAEFVAFVFAVVAPAVTVAVLWRAAPASGGVFAEGERAETGADPATSTFVVGAIAAVLAGIAAIAWSARAG